MPLHDPIAMVHRIALHTISTAALVVTAAERPAITYTWSPGSSAVAAAADSQGNVCVVGGAYNGFKPTPEAAFPQAGSDNLSYLVEFNARGEVLYATYLPGYARAVAVDSAGSAYVAGGLATPVTEPWKGYVLRIDRTGTKVLSSLSVGGAAASQIALDGRGGLYIAGRAHSPDFTPTAGAFQTKARCVSVNCDQMFLLKVDIQNSQVVYATYLGGSWSQSVLDMAVDPPGSVYLAGSTDSLDFPVTTNALVPAFPQNRIGSAGFVSKVNPSGSALVYSTYFHGGVRGIALDSAGSAYLTGYPDENFVPTAGAYQTAQSKSFLAKLSPDGRAMPVATFLSPQTSSSYAERVLLDPSGDVVVAGETFARRPSEFPVLAPIQAVPGNQIRSTCFLNNHQTACSDVFVLKLDSEGKNLIWSTVFGGTDNDTPYSMAQDAAGKLYLLVSHFPGFPLQGGVAGDFAVVRIETAGTPPLMQAEGVVNAAGFTPGISRGGIATVFGTGFLENDDILVAPSFPLPDTLGGVSVWINGASAPILSVAKIGAQEQINFQVPNPSTTGPIENNNIIIRSRDTLGFAFGFYLTYFRPGIFVNAEGQPAVTHADGSLVTNSNPARAGERIVIYGTGLGEVTPPTPLGEAAGSDPLSRTTLSPTVALGGLPAAVEFAGLTPGFAGLYQVNIVVPQVPPGPSRLTLTVFQTEPSVTVTIPVQ